MNLFTKNNFKTWTKITGELFLLTVCLCLFSETSFAQDNGQYSVIAGGKQNKILGDFAFIGGGEDNFIGANGDYSVIPNGKNVSIDGLHSWAMGKNIKIATGANNVFFWGYQDDNTTATNGPLTVSQSDSFIIYHTPNASAPEGPISAVKVGINILTPLYTLHVKGGVAANTIIITAPTDIAGTAAQQSLATSTTPFHIGQDIAELFPAAEKVEPGDVLVISPDRDELLVKKSSRPYDQTVVGIVSSAPALVFEGDQIISDFKSIETSQRPPVALSGRVPCKVTLENGPIQPGDLLTTSSMPGHAMKAERSDRAFGTIVGKAMEKFENSEQQTGMITVFVGLQ
ncbi:MAG TPA: hypothetical protein VLJ10_00030 [Candidatus Bathyarchaeia archaeon]|nr:hypothetical protein [Candidatus Bathyarchaeia archaeon]